MFDSQNWLQYIFGGTLGDITEISKHFPELVVKSRRPFACFEDLMDSAAEMLFGGSRLSDYGGFWIRDSKAVIEDHETVAVRIEHGGRFGYGTLMFDIDYKPTWRPKLLTALSRTGKPWAVCETPNGFHIHYLGEYWYPSSSTHWASSWRSDYLRAYDMLIEVGIMPDLRHTIGSILQCRSYVRLQPKQGAAFTFRDPMFVGVRQDLPRICFLDDESDYIYNRDPGCLEIGTNYAGHAMDAVLKLASLRNN